MDETNQGPKHNLFHLLIQFHLLNCCGRKFSLDRALRSIMNHASILCRPCLKFCEILLLMRFSRIVFKNFEKIQISWLTVESRDV